MTSTSPIALLRLELVVAMGTWRMVPGILTSVEMPLEDGVMTWPPDGKGSA